MENELVHAHREIGVEARRVPLSGAAVGYKGDIKVILRDREITGEVKARATGSGFVTLERWLGDNDALFLRRDRAPAMVLLPWETWA